MPQSANPPAGATPDPLTADLTPTQENPTREAPDDPTPESSALDPYRKSVETLMVNQSPLGISNSQPAHAAILFEKFFEHAKRCVRVFSWHLDPAVFGDVTLCARAEEALRRGIRLFVITQDTPRESAFLELLRRYPEQVTLINANEGNLGQDVVGQQFNFAVMDDRAFRTEPDRTTGKAQAVMNAPSYATRLIAYFDTLLTRFKPSQRAVV